MRSDLTIDAFQHFSLFFKPAEPCLCGRGKLLFDGNTEIYTDLINADM